MRLEKGAGPARRGVGVGSRKIVKASGKSDERSSSLTHSQDQAVRAELIGAHTATARGIEARGSAPVLRLCRQLLAAGCDPTLPLHCYRGEVLCLRVRSLETGARLTVEECSDGRPRFRPYKRWPSDGSPAMRQNGPGLPEHWIEWPAATEEAVP